MILEVFRLISGERKKQKPERSKAAETDKHSKSCMCEHKTHKIPCNRQLSRQKES